MLFCLYESVCPWGYFLNIYKKIILFFCSMCVWVHCIFYLSLLVTMMGCLLTTDSLTFVLKFFNNNRINNFKTSSFLLQELQLIFQCKSLNFFFPKQCFWKTSWVTYSFFACQPICAEVILAPYIYPLLHLYSVLIWSQASSFPFLNYLNSPLTVS